jgi:Flp pilus assembly protein CpaB
MTTTIRRTPAASGPGVNGAAIKVAGAKGSRVPWVALGLILVLTGALVFGMTVQRAGQRTPVVVAARDIDPGVVIEARDLRIVDIAIDGSASVIAGPRLGALVGRTATSRIPSGTVVSDGQFVEGSGVPAGRVVVGALLGPGGLPVPNLRAGDVVTMLAAADPDTAGEGEPIGDASVYLVSRGAQPGSQFVSLSVDERASQLVTDAAAASRLRLVLRSGQAR